MDHASLSGGFADPPHQSAIAFRGIMQAMARPGTVRDIAGAVPPAPMSVAAGTILATLCDADTGLYLAGDFDTRPIRDWITFHTSAPFVAAPQAQFVLGRWADVPRADLSIGTSEYPDRAAIVIVEMPALAPGGATLRGPGIETTAALNLPEIAAFQDNAALFPLGLDFMFTSGTQIACLPRSTKVS